MDKEVFQIYMRNEPSEPADRFIFLVDNKALSERVVLSGFRSTPILDYDTGGQCFTLTSFLEYMRSLECKGTCRSDYIYVTACSTKTVNDALNSYLSGESLNFRSGWRLFKGKEYLEDADHEAELIKILSDYIGEGARARIRPAVVSDVQEEETSWLIPGYIPDGQISLLVGDGGQGKTSVWCNVVAGITAGKKTIMEEGNPFPEESKPGTCMFFSSEDSVPKVLKKRLQKAGADESRILFVDLTDPNFDRIKFNAPELADLVAEYKPALVVFDPLQSFIPASVQMGSRNAMRQSLSPLTALGEKFGTAFLIVMHTNKKPGASGRNRCADSADIWDQARSILIVGDTGEDNLHYLSQEKCNYGELNETILYAIEDGAVVYRGTTHKKDKDFVSEHLQASRPSPAKEEAKEIIMDVLSDGEDHKVLDVDAIVKSSGVSFATLKRSKKELKTEGRIRYRCEGYGVKKVFYMSAVRQSVNR